MSRRWTCEITVVEHRRTAILEADPKSEAIAKLRAAEWDELGDPLTCTFTKVGPMREDTAPVLVEDQND